MSADLADQGKRSARPGMQIESWPLKIYSLGFVVAFALHLAFNGIERPPALLFVVVVTLSVGMWRGQGPWLRAGVMLGILHALIFPVLQQTVANGESMAAVVTKVPIWPQLLATLIGSRVLAAEGKLSFVQFWRHPTKQRPTVEIQSIPSAIAFGAFLTLVFYVVAPQALTPSSKRPLDVIVSAMLGGTIVHSSLIFLFFVILSSILDMALRHVADRSIVSAFARRVEKNPKVGTQCELAAVLQDEFAAVAHTRAFRLLNAAIETEAGASGHPARLATLSFDGFQVASRQFVRALLPLLPLLGFLGTVIGLATAISELPHGLTESAEHAFDISGSLAGLAVKFETTLLGLVASMISSLSLNFLEKREAELSAACLLVVKSAGERSA